MKGNAQEFNLFCFSVAKAAGSCLFDEVLVKKKHDDFTHMLDQTEGSNTLSEYGLQISSEIISALRGEQLCPVSKMLGWASSDVVEASLRLHCKRYKISGAVVLSCWALKDMKAFLACLSLCIRCLFSRASDLCDVEWIRLIGQKQFFENRAP